MSQSIQIEPNIARPEVPLMKLEIPSPASFKKLAYFEIFLYLIIVLYIYNKLAKKFYITEVSKDQQEFKKNPSFLMDSDTEKAGMSRSGGFVEIVVRQANVLFGAYKQVFNSMFGSVSKIAGEQGSALNRLRKFMQPIRIFIKSIVQYFYKKLENIMIGSLYMYHKMRQLILRTFSSFNLVFHTLEHLVNTMQSIPNSGIVQAIISMEGFFSFIRGASYAVCFLENTPIRLQSGQYIRIKDIQCGSQLHDGSFVKTKFTFLNIDDANAYEIPDDGSVIHVSGSHIIFDKYESGMQRWKQVRDCRLARQTTIKPEKWYCLSTSNNRIQVGSFTFCDYEEVSHNPNLIFLINLMQLQQLNAKAHDVPNYTYPSIQLDNGLSEHTLVKLISGEWKKLADIQLGDYLESPNDTRLGETTMINRVYGTADLLPSLYSKYLWNGIMCTGNSKVYEPTLDMWLNVELSMNARLMEKLKSNRVITNIDYGFRHLFTTCGAFIVYDPLLNTEVIWRDFQQINNEKTNDWITERILSELNYNEIKKSRL